MDLEDPSFDFVPSKDDRPRAWNPPPVTVVAIADVKLACSAGAGTSLDDFYVTVLGFELGHDPDRPVYRAENVRVVFEVFEGPVERDDFRPLQLQVRDLERVRLGLIERKMEFTSTHRLHTSDEVLFLPDPAGNYLEIVEFRPVF